MDEWITVENANISLKGIMYDTRRIIYWSQGVFFSFVCMALILGHSRVRSIFLLIFLMARFYFNEHEKGEYKIIHSDKIQKIQVFFISSKNDHF